MFNRTPSPMGPSGENVTTPLKPIPPRSVPSTAIPGPPPDGSAAEWVLQSTRLLSWAVVNVLDTLQDLRRNNIDRLADLNPDQAPTPEHWLHGLRCPDEAKLNPVDRAFADEWLASLGAQIVRARDDRRQLREAEARQAAIAEEEAARAKRVALEESQRLQRQAAEARRKAEDEAAKARALEARRRWDATVAAAR